MVVPSTAKTNVALVLANYKKEIEKSILSNMDVFGGKTTLRDACEYALTNDGKRFRPALVMFVARALGNGADVTQAALAVEYFHTASLIADDLPCMDNDDVRRNRPSLHKVYGEAVSLLVSYALIAAGYECLAKNTRQIQQANSDHICLLALENATYNTGLFGATGGQFLDINPPDLSLTTLRDIIHKKTVSLFEISFVLGWVYGGGNVEKLETVKKAASHFGMAFQIADDIGDVEQDIQKGRQVNIATVFGKPAALKMFHVEIEMFLETLDTLRLNIQELHDIATILTQQAEAASLS